MKNTIDFKKHHEAKTEALEKTDRIIAYLAEQGSEENEFYNPEDLRKAMEQEIYKSELYKRNK